MGNERECYNCKRRLDDEPAIRGLRGFLCFPCRYNFDKDGGEGFILESQSYQERQRDWEINHKDRWVKYQSFKKFANISLYIIAISIFTPGFFFLFEKNNKIFVFCFLQALIFFIIRRLLLKKAQSIPYLPPPLPPKRNKNSLFAILDVVYDDALKDENEEFLKIKGYPPDWEERQKRCLIRDSYKCRICKKTKRLHIHHVKPISYGGTHSLQNLITLCSACHKKQGYYQHQDLIMENIKASRRYWVSPHIRSDGRKVSGYFRRTGRRGLFWRKIRRIRS